MQDLQQRAADKLRVRVGLREEPRHHAGAQHRASGVLDGAEVLRDRGHMSQGRIRVGATAGQQSQEVRFA